MRTIYNIAESMAEVMGLQVVRLDITSYRLGDVSGYVGYLHTEDNVYRIRKDGTFELVEE